MNIVIIGPKGSGKTTIGRNLSKELNTNFIDTDNLIEEFYLSATGFKKTFREIYKEVGEAKFREIEEESLKSVSDHNWSIISTGGSTFLSCKNRQILRKNSIIVLLETELECLWSRLSKNSLPAYLENISNPKEIFFNKVRLNKEIVLPFADLIVDTTDKTPNEVVSDLTNKLSIEFTIRMNSSNTFGEQIRITTFGESHGKALGVVLDGVPPNIDFDGEIVQNELNRRRPGQSQITTQRNEDDKVKILSGVFEGKTTGCPIAMIVENKDQDSSKYDNLKDIFRTGHADFTFFKKYGIRDHRGGGRTSGRETIGRVAGGTLAKELLNKMGVKIIAYTLKIGDVSANKIDYDVIEKNPVRSCDKDASEKMESLILEAKKNMVSLGGIVGIEVKGLPAGIGDPVFAKLDARLGMALLSIGAVKGIEFGLGFEFAKLTGEQSNDPMNDGKFVSNNAGGILGGISTGEDIVMRIVVKPTPSIAKPQKTINKNGENVSIEIKVDTIHVFYLESYQ